MRDLKTYLSVAPVVSTLWFGSFLYTFPGSVATAGFTQSIGSYRYPFNTT